MIAEWEAGWELLLSMPKTSHLSHAEGSERNHLCSAFVSISWDTVTYMEMSLKTFQVLHVVWGSVVGCSILFLCQTSARRSFRDCYVLGGKGAMGKLPILWVSATDRSNMERALWLSYLNRCIPDHSKVKFRKSAVGGCSWKLHVNIKNRSSTFTVLKEVQEAFVNETGKS